jgi:hypothetical protein
MVLLTDVYRNLTSLWIKPRERAFKQFKSPVLNVLIKSAEGTRENIVYNTSFYFLLLNFPYFNWDVARCVEYKLKYNIKYKICIIQGGSNMTRTVYICLHTNQCRSYLKHPVHTDTTLYFFKIILYYNSSYIFPPYF